ncbi:sulfatase [Halegenticoccus tardaugens]|uniref:sulfatase n=1 Tax=Halegenticoccus tardaugens TaxID=2071624 RepID=UPI00100A6F88|nr:sulfatase [Halegenticoccus tardaugens]
MSERTRNIILLSADALRADHLSCYGYDRNTSPNLDRFASENVQFVNAYSASSHTREAVPALLTGRYPDDAIDEKYQLDAPTVATYLKYEGYEAAGFHSNPFVSRAYGYNRDFDVFDDDLHLGRHKIVALAQRALDKLRNRHYARAAEINERSLNWIDSLDEGQPFFLWNHYMDPHGPYEPFDTYRERFHDESVSDKRAQILYKRAISDPKSISDEERKTLVDLYDAEIRYTDEHVGAFFNALANRDLLDDAIVIFTADHGDAFGEHGYYEHPRYLHNELTRVPLLFRHPDESKATVKYAVSTVDVLPTILSWVSVDPEGLPGDPLVPPTSEAFEDRTVFCQARGEGQHSAVRRFRACSTAGSAFAEARLSGSEIELTNQKGNAVLSERLSDHIASRVSEFKSVEKRAEKQETKAISDRLEALGYKE